MACRDHNKQLIMACGQCKTAVCDECIELHHNGHQPFLTLKSAAKTVIENLQKATDNPDYTKIEKDFEEFSKKCQGEKMHADRTKQELLNRRDNLKAVLDQVTEAAVNKLERHKESVLEELDRVKTDKEQKCKTIDDFKGTVQRLSTSQDYLEVVVQGWNLKPPETSTVDFPNISELKFSAGTRRDETNRVEMLFGELKLQDTTSHHDGTISSDLGHSKIDMFSTLSICSDELFGDGPGENPISAQSDDSTKIKLSHSCESLRCDVKLIYQRSLKLGSSPQTMVPTTEGKCWILASPWQTLHLVDTKGEVINILQAEIAFPDDVSSASQDNSTFLAYFTKKCVKRGTLMINKNEGKHSFEMSTFIRTDPMFLRCVCLIPNGDIFVGLTNKPHLPSGPDHTSVLVRYNQKGKEIRRVQKDGHGQDMFYIPVRIKKSNTGSVAVVNFTESGTAHLVLLDNDLNLTHRYIDHGVALHADEPLPGPAQKFMITDALFNHQDLLLISEYYSRTVQLLDPSCNLLKVLVTDLQNPVWSLAQHAGGDLWVGVEGGEIKVYTHTIDYSLETL
ncbi:uncharacterized protein [Argopecten irradians]|uniref:uncharacterized protein n=1 Tax=Argopecten irradians TaxID=31199 RepID=UPI00371F34FF